MNRFYYDFHIHSCLSPCADNDNTPNNLLGMAKLSGIDILALTDHNSTKNCPAFFEAAESYDVIPIAGMELTTSEDIHSVCLFERLEDAMDFDAEIQKRRVLIENRPKIFGEQLILDKEDNVIATEENLLPNATDISIEELPSLVKKFGGICYPAHIDREANGIISVLGTFPPTPHFSLAELHDMSKKDELSNKHPIKDKRFIYGSDAHYLTDIRDAEHYFELNAEKRDKDGVRKELFSLLR